MSLVPRKDSTSDHTNCTNRNTKTGTDPDPAKKENRRRQHGRANQIRLPRRRPDPNRRAKTFRDPVRASDQALAGAIGREKDRRDPGAQTSGASDCKESDNANHPTKNYRRRVNAKNCCVATANAH